MTPRADDRRVVVQRVVRSAGRLRLTDEVEDSDRWDGVLTFAR